MGARRRRALLKAVCTAVCTAACAACLAAGLAQAAPAEAPWLGNVFLDDDTLIPGKTVLNVEYEAGAAGILTMGARPLGSGGAFETVAEFETAAGRGTISWDGNVGGQAALPGAWELLFSLRDGAGAVSPAYVAAVNVLGAAGPTMTPREARVRREPGPDRQLSAFPDPHQRCFWNMDIDNLDPEAPEDWPAIWEILMQPVTVLDADPKAHVYPLTSPDANPKDPANYAGQLHGASQGVHVLETLPGGWTHIEAYANDGYNAPRKFLRELNATLIHGYVQTSRLKTVEPNKNIAVLIDKLRQRLYVFQDGAMTGQLKVSTGLKTKGQPHSETPAGEFLTDSWVGMFMNGNMYCDLAIRINGGILLHDVPYIQREGGEPNWAPFEQFMVKKASHGCVRVQRAQNEQGMNMRWLWNNLSRQCKVLIWDDRGREHPPPDPALPLYYNPNGGKNYHSNQRCPGVKNRFLPLTGFYYGELIHPPYDKLTPCATCDPPPRHEDESIYFVPEEVLGFYDEAWEEP
jgi:hypothetical protein